MNLDILHRVIIKSNISICTVHHSYGISNLHSLQILMRESIFEVFTLNNPLKELKLSSIEILKNNPNISIIIPKLPSNHDFHISIIY